MKLAFGAQPPTPMKTQYYTAATLDGFVASPEHSLDWLFQFGEFEVTSYAPFIAEVGALAMGSSTYEWLLTHHIKLDSAQPGAWPYEQPTWVFTSRQLPLIPGANIQFVRGDVRPVHQQMIAAAGGKNVWIAGGGAMAGQFYDAGLLDELIIQIAPVTLGRGFPVLPRATAPLRLTSVAQFGPGFVELRYDVPPRVAS